jgi:hypothetical protein
MSPPSVVVTFLFVAAENLQVVIGATLSSLLVNSGFVEMRGLVAPHLRQYQCQHLIIVAIMRGNNRTV